MKKYCLLIDEKNKLHISGMEQSAVDWEVSRGRKVIGYIESDLNIIELTEFVCGTGDTK